MGFKLPWKLLGLRDDGYSSDKCAFWCEGPKNSGVRSCWRIYRSDTLGNAGTGVMQSDLLGCLRASVDIHLSSVLLAFRFISSASRFCLHTSASVSLFHSAHMIGGGMCMWQPHVALELSPF